MERKPRGVIERFAFPLAVLIIGVVATAALALLFADRASDSRHDELARSTAELRGSIESHLAAQIEVMHGVQSFEAVTSPTRAEFIAYITENGVLERLSGVQALSWSPRLDRSELDTYIASVRSDRSVETSGYPDFDVRTGGADELVVVDYIVPFDGNEAAFGFDLASNPARLAAIEQTRATGRVIATEPITLVQETGDQAGLLLLLAGFDPATGIRGEAGVEGEAVDGFRGVVSAVYRAGDLLAKVAELTGRPFSVTDRGSFDGVGPAEPVELFSTHPERTPATQGVTLNAAGRAWEIVVLDGAVTTGSKLALVTAIVTGLAASAAAAGFAWARGEAALQTDLLAMELSSELNLATERQRQIINAGNIWLWEINQSTGKAWTSPEFATGLGYTEEEFRPMRPVDMLHPDDFPDFVGRKASEEDAHQYRVLHADGDYRWVLSRESTIERDGDTIRMGVTIDVTAERDHQDRFVRLSRRLEMASHEAGVGFWERNTTTGEWWTSPNFELIVGFDPTRWMKDWPDNLPFHPADRELIATQMTAQARGEDTEFTFRIAVGDGADGDVRLDGEGEYREILTRSRLVEHEGDSIRIGANIDVTEDRQREAELAHLVSRLEQTSHAANVAFWEHDLGTGRYWTSPNFEQVVGVDPDTWMPNWPDGVGVHPDDRPKIDDHLEAEQRSASRLETSAITYRVANADGTYRSIQSRSTIVHRSSGAVVLGANLDVTADRERESELSHVNEQLMLSNDSLAEFTSVASHDLRSPLRAIRSLVSFLREDAAGSLDATCTHHIDRIDERAALMSRLLDDLLAYAQSTGGRNKPTLVAVESVLTRVLGTADTSGEVEVSVDCPIEPVWIEEVPLETCVRNLVDNALKYHPGPTGHVHLSASRDGDFLTIEVADDGDGIDPQFHEQIFEPFRSLAPAGVGTGSGIGLAVVRRMAQARGGDVTVESVPGDGATFRLRWPIERPETRERHTRNDVADPPNPARSDLKSTTYVG